MALLYSRLVARHVRTPLTIATRTSTKHRELPDPLDLATGLEKKELMAIQSGNMDPFKMMAVARKPSTKNDPNIVHSYFDCRIVGCVCEEDSSHIVWMWVFKGEPRRCQCGHWFKLEKYNPF